MAPGVSTPEKTAPGPLELVQRFVNSVDLESGEDELAGPEELRAWLAERDLIAADARVTRADFEPRDRRARGPARAADGQQRDAAVDAQRVARLDRRGRGRGVRVVFAPGSEPRLAPEAGGVDGAIGAPAGDRRRGGRAGPLGAPQGLPARRLPLGLLRPLEEPLGPLVPDGGLRQHREGARVPRAQAPSAGRRRATTGRRSTGDRGASPRMASLDRVDLEQVGPADVPAGSPAVMPILSPTPASPTSRAASAQRSIRSSVWSGSSLRRGWTPQSSWHWRTTDWLGDERPAPAPAAGRPRSASRWCPCWWATRCT